VGLSLIRLSLLAKSISYLTIFFSQNKSANSIFYYGLLAKQTRRTRRSGDAGKAADARLRAAGQGMVAE
jgi:hypothetical protein